MKRMGRPPVDPVVRFWAKVDKTDECWLWTGALRNRDGYGAFQPIHGQPVVNAHIWAYIQANGPIPKGLVIDHQCHDPQVCILGRSCPHRRCVNPMHMVLTTRSVNSSAARRGSPNRRKTHCPRGHPYDEENTRVDPKNGKRFCRICDRERHTIQRRYTAQRKEPT